MHILIVLLLYATFKLLFECSKYRSQYCKFEYGGYLMVKLDLVYNLMFQHLPPPTFLPPFLLPQFIRDPCVRCLLATLPWEWRKKNTELTPTEQSQN